MQGEAEGSQRELVRRYFALVDAGDPAWLDLFDEQVQFFYPKFGMTQGKAALHDFARRIGRLIAALQHDLDGFVYTEQAGRVVVEGREWGQAPDGRRWPRAPHSQGLFCSVFEIAAGRIVRMHVYVDPDLLSDDEARLALLAKE